MGHKHRGWALVFDQHNFDNVYVSTRKGSEHDRQRLHQTLSSMGFQVEMYEDCTLAEIESTLKEVSARDHSDCDCFILVFMSHGLEGKLAARDKIFDVNLLWQSFTPERSPSLKGKPKIFVMQSCQGHGHQKGVWVKAETTIEEEEGKEKVELMPSYQIPERADFLLALSTIPGFVSYRIPGKGSPFIQSLCHQLDHRGNEDMLMIMTNVIRNVAINFSICNPRRPNDPCYKQLPSFISTLIKILKFPKTGKSNKKRKRKCDGICGKCLKRKHIGS